MSRATSPAGQSRLEPCSLPDTTTDDPRRADVAAISLRLAESLDLPTVLATAAREVAALFGGACLVRFSPAGSPAGARRAVAGPVAAPDTGGASDLAETYAALLACLDGPHAPAGLEQAGAAAEPGAELLLAPLIARGRRIGEITVVLPAQDGASLCADQRLLRAVAAHAALAVDTADRVSRLAQSPAGAQPATPEGDPGALLSLVAHDLRCSLATVSASVQSLVRAVGVAGPLDRGRVGRLVELAEASVVQLEGQLSALVPERRAAPLDDQAMAKAVDLLRLARLMANFYQQTTSRHQIVVCAEVAEIVGPWAQPQVERVLGNLIVNAIKYSPAGGEIRVVLGREEDSLGAWATVSVQNQGIGVPPQDLARLGQPGFRARNVGAIPGTGFGLASIREIVEHYGGTFALQSSMGGTTTAHIRLPLAGVGAER